jgi:hypothetical protein
MASINQSNPAIDQTVKIFDQFYAYEADVPANEYDVVRSFFRSVFVTDEAANNFTDSLFRVAEQSGQSAMDLLATFENQSSPEISLTLCYYLNGQRSPATLLGVQSQTSPNFYTARNVRQ